MRKEHRQKATLGLIERGELSRQDQIVEGLVRQGFHVTQASVSRDLAELGIAKVKGHYVLPVPPDPSTTGVLDIANAGENLLVIKCRPGLASALAVNIDAARISGIVGTIAGDDTIFIAVVDGEVQGVVRKRLLDVLVG